MAFPIRQRADGARIPTDNEYRLRREEVIDPRQAPAPLPPPAPVDFGDDGGTDDGGTSLEPLPAPAPPGPFSGAPQPAPAFTPGVPPPPPPRATVGAAGSGLEGTFTQPGTRGAAPFRTAEYFQGRFTAPRSTRLGAGSPIGVQGSMTDLSGGMDEAFGDKDELRRRLLDVIAAAR